MSALTVCNATRMASSTLGSRNWIIGRLAALTSWGCARAAIVDMTLLLRLRQLVVDTGAFGAGERCLPCATKPAYLALLKFSTPLLQRLLQGPGRIAATGALLRVYYP